MRNPASRQITTTISPWNSATVAPPSVRPIMIRMRGTGATSVSFRKPNWRSQISSIPEKIAVNRMRHADHARRQELDVVALPRPLEDGPEAEAQRQQKQQRLAQRRDDARPRPEVALQLAQPQDVDGAHRVAFPRNMRAMLRIWSTDPASSSRMVDPVSARKAFSSVSAPVCSLSSAAVPCATILP